MLVSSLNINVRRQAVVLSERQTFLSNERVLFECQFAKGRRKMKFPFVNDASPKKEEERKTSRRRETSTLASFFPLVFFHVSQLMLEIRENAN